MDLYEKIRTLPTQPGVYLYKNAEGEVIYVGKAKNLRARVRSYLLEASQANAKTGSLMREAVDLDYILVANEHEALALENNLIKQRHPRFNILLRDDKTYPYVKLTLGDRYPKVFVTRRLRKDGAAYYGPYFPGNLAYRIVELIHRSFSIPSCKVDLSRYHQRACLQYYIHRCLGPCVEGLTTPETYAMAVRDAQLLLEGRSAELERALTVRMIAAAEAEQFEAAARLRDQLSTVHQLQEKQRIATAEQDEQDREHESDYRRLRAQMTGALVAAVVAMTLSMPLMRQGSVDPVLHRITMWLDAPIQALFPVLYTLPAGVLRWTLLVLSMLVMLFAGRRFYTKAWAAARHRTSDMNMLIAVGTGAAFLYSAVVTLAPAAFESRGVAPEVYFEAVIFILALVLAGNLLEARARRSASSAMRALASLQPSTARVEKNGQETDTPLDKLQLGDIVVVKPGERVPADGVVLTGASGVDESMLTGEPEPVDKQAGSAIIGGTTNGQGVLRARVTALGGETMLEKVLRLLRAAQGEKAPMQRLADRVSAIFVPAVFGISLLTFAVWMIAGHDIL